MNEILIAIQSELKAPKNQTNTFGHYNYRNAEDILEGLKPLLKEHNASVVTNDDIILIGDRYYVKTTATLYVGEKSISACGYAREPLEQKGMSPAQITGASSSYAKKYALGNLFAIDDTKDSDSDNVPPSTPKPLQSHPMAPQPPKDVKAQIAEILVGKGIVGADQKAWLEANYPTHFKAGLFDKILDNLKA